ncbi:putative F-box protein At3g58860 [Papaver somniferum]|uniref:putative F-box protein At3g58860 n=1 Tax=Papaver somniferum TaxID=3469 RepID=UPI000E6F6E9D|nr:putative F-box protein At3g58860 [Papaver somniferum]
MAKKNRKIVRRDEMDHTSNLPDDLLVIILSLVPTEQAITTSFLSHRWKFFWNLLPELDFDYASFCKSFGIVLEHSKKERFRGFLDFVDYVFTHHQVKHLYRLRFGFDISRHKNYAFDKNYSSEVRRLFRFPMRRNCSTLDLQFLNLITPCLYPTYHGMYTLPPCKTLPYQSVIQWKLTNCKLTIYKGNSFLSVKIAKFTVVELRKKSVYDLVSKCPCLEELHLIRCKLPSSSFKLNSPESNLKCLVLQQSEAKDRMLNTRDNEHELLCKLLQDLCNVEVLTLCYQNLECNTAVKVPEVGILYDMSKKNRKIVRRDEMDLISNFPDDLLARILFLVPTEQAVTTSFLSQRWKSLWNLLPELDFDYVSFCKSFGIVLEHRGKELFRGFLEFVDYVFIHHQVKHLHML